MAAAEIQMQKCYRCHYYYPSDAFNRHLEACRSAESRFNCPICNCDYPSAEINQHVDTCDYMKRDENMADFVCEYSRGKFSKNAVKRLIKTLRQSDDEICARDILRSINAADFKIEKWVTFDDDPQIECPICITEVPIDDIFVLSCIDNHKVCYDCLYSHSAVKLNDNAALTCPNGKCNQIIHVNELCTLPFPRHMVKKLVEKYEKQLFDGFVHQTAGAIRCPNGTCNWVGMVDNMERLNITCAKCKTGFCTICRGISHYRVECQDIPRLIQEWMVWSNVGRIARRREKEKFNQDIQQYEKAKGANEQRNADLRRAFDELKQDETYKSQNCRLCPHCARVVQKVDGCDAMVCGRNYHGGDAQNGCGMGFNWAQARPYASQLQNEPALEQLALQAPKKAQNVNHYPYKCDACDQDIVGIRFECIHCDCVNFCENCETEQTLYHPKGHTFKLITEAE